MSYVTVVCDCCANEVSDVEAMVEFKSKTIGKKLHICNECINAMEEQIEHDKKKVEGE